jgi:hypothetical protein
MVYEHFVKAHRRQPTRADINVNIIQQGFATTLEREEAEKLLIQKLKPTINIVHNS